MEIQKKSNDSNDNVGREIEKSKTNNNCNNTDYYSSSSYLPVISTRKKIYFYKVPMLL